MRETPRYSAITKVQLCIAGVPSQQSDAAVKPVAAEIRWNCAQLFTPQTSPEAHPTLSSGSQSAQQSRFSGSSACTHTTLAADSPRNCSR